MSQAGGQPPLAAKEASLFRQVLKHYETKQYKKGLKAADQILRKNLKHGETMAMKGLLINCQGRKEEAFTIAKEALRQDMKSHVCWHVYGLLWRSDKNFDEAIKAYKMALRFEPESQQILRDLALLQIQMRDYTGYVESRRTMVITKPQFRQNWTGLAIAHHLAGNLAEAENTLTKYEETLKVTPPKSDIENSEAILYKNYIIAETGDYEKALGHLESISKIAVDRVAVLEARAEYNLKLGKTEAAEKAYRYLVDRNADKREYYSALEKVLGLTGEDRKKFYDDYAAKYPRADAPRRIPLDFLEDDAFREVADAYVQRLLTKGVPSTFANLKALYGDANKLKTLEEIVKAFLQKQRDATKSTDDETKLTNGDGKPDETMLWTLYYLSQHYDHYRIRDTEKALVFINEALEISPDKVELRMGLARILKHAGDPQKGMEEMELARQKDTSDRFINTKCAKYQLRNDRNNDGLATMGMFTRNEANGGPLGDLIEMQCVWFLTEDGESFNRQGKLGLALKRFHSVYKIFDDWTEDQFDFHSFSLRKGMIRSYIEMVRWEDSLWSHPFFSRAALAAIKIYILLNDRPHLAHDSLSNGTGLEADFESLSTADRKKAMKKAKREAQKQEKVASDAAAKAKDERKGGEEKKQDEDPLGAKLAQTSEPLEKAMVWLKPLLEFSPKVLEAQTVGFEVYVRRRKYLLALKCLLAASKLSPDDAIVHEQVIRFQTTIAKVRSSLPDTTTSIIDSAFTLLPKDANLSQVNESFLQEHSSSAQRVFAVIRTRQLLLAQANSGSAAALTDSETLLIEVLDKKDTTLSEAVEGMNMIKESKGDLNAYLEKARTRWPMAAQFKARA